jgi:hypothetical protein
MNLEQEEGLIFDLCPSLKIDKIKKTVQVFELSSNLLMFFLHIISTSYFRFMRNNTILFSLNVQQSLDCVFLFAHEILNYFYDKLMYCYGFI